MLKGGAKVLTPLKGGPKRFTLPLAESQNVFDLRVSHFRPTPLPVINEWSITSFKHSYNYFNKITTMKI